MSHSPLLRRVLTECLFAGVMILALSMIYRPVVVGRVLAGGDLQLYFYPYWMVMTRAFHGQGSVLWNPYLFAGVPLLANSQVGALYPLNWPFWFLSAPELGAVAQALHGSVLLHLALAAVSAYALARMQMTRWLPAADGRCASLALRGGAAVAGLIYAGGGFLAVHVEHLNQLQALAWLPLCFLPGQPVPAARGSAGRRTRTGVVAIVAFAMILLAGHTQMAFITAVGSVVWLGVEAIQDGGVSPSGSPRRWKRGRGEAGAGELPPPGSRRERVRSMIAQWVGRLAPFALAGLPAGAQLLPSLELARLSGRSGTYAWREAVSFSIPPWQLPRALLPPYITSPLLPEGVAYTGLLALAFAGLGVWVTVRRRRGWGLAVLAGVGLFLALGGYNPLYLFSVRVGVPGFAHFRAPARFLSLFVLGTAMLAGLGVEAVVRTRKRAVGVLGAGMLVAGVAVELWFGGQALPYADATTRRAYTDLRPATAHLVAATSAAAEEGFLGGHRFVSISQTLFEVGDKDEIEGIYGDVLPADAVWAYLVATKQREVLAPNLSLAFEVPAVDGYDGGLLPLRAYTAFSRLLLPEGTSDGRLRENLTGVPEHRWLDLLGVRYLLTDKTGDVWIQDVLYDRQFRPALAEGETLHVAWLPGGFIANTVRLLYTGSGEVVVGLADGREVRAALPDSSNPDVAQQVEWEGGAAVVALEIRAVDGALHLSGASLVDDRLGSFYPLVLSDVFRLVHSGDVKIYEVLEPPARAFLVHASEVAPSVAAAIDAMARADFDPARSVVLMSKPGVPENNAVRGSDAALVSSQDEQVRVVAYDPTRVVVDVDAAGAGHLVLTDAWYPGWSAQVSPQPGADGAQTSEAVTVPVLQADVLFRSVPVSQGRWRVTLQYAPRLIPAGLGLSFLGLVGLVIYSFAVFQQLHTLCKPRRF